MVALCALGGCFVQAKKAEWLQYKKVGKKQGSQSCVAGCVGLGKSYAGSRRLGQTLRRV